MTTIQAQVPDALVRQVIELAEREKVPVDQLVNLALSPHKIYKFNQLISVAVCNRILQKWPGISFLTRE